MYYFLLAIFSSRCYDLEGSRYYEPRAGEEFEVGSLEISVLSPSSISEKDNEESLAFKITYGEIDFIFTGDADKNAELKILNTSFDLDSEILHVGHHGSNTSTHPNFLTKQARSLPPQV